ncbi:hypothetical protein AC578_3107 [Pseudocercospora eumusae]|uniref:Uncharacterized protein n=1 Tax=Pseudocercospora eumusae TaxID=321146 RepID=A0A139GUZ1_9PEZI|nr:hypothetical protein AC578_3107 [Pseudocercospora eumusae]
MSAIKIPALDLATTSNYKGVARGGLEVALSLTLTLSTPVLDLATTSNYKGVARGGLEVALSLT